jgi:U3 small nucleolar RNA-associated protein 15
MSSDYQKLRVKKFPSLKGRTTAESRYWKKFKSPITVKEFNSITSIHFSVTASTRVQIYSCKTHSAYKTISRFRDVAYSGVFRKDGKLLVAGDETGLVQVFDVDNKVSLRSFKDHIGPVHATQFLSDQTHIVSASDDKTVRYWDLPTEQILHTFDEHQDYVRALMPSLNSNLWLTGSYDHSLKLWDARTSSSVMTWNHDAPVECVLMFPNDGMALSTGDNIIKVWDIFKGGNLPLHTFSHHQKTITTMCFNSSFSRLLTGSLDQHIKIYNIEDFKLEHSIKYSAPILSVALSPDETHLVTGMSDGSLCIKQRLFKDDKEKHDISEEKTNIRAGTYFIRGKSLSSGPQDFKVLSTRKPKLRPYDIFLRKFQYKKALDMSLASVSPSINLKYTIFLMTLFFQECSTCCNFKCLGGIAS